MGEAKAKAAYRQSEEYLQAVAGGLRDIFPDEIEFALVIFGSGDSKYAGYVSSAERSSMISALRECAENLELKFDVPSGEPIPGLDTEPN